MTAQYRGKLSFTYSFVTLNLKIQQGDTDLVVLLPNIGNNTLYCYLRFLLGHRYYSNALGFHSLD